MSEAGALYPVTEADVVDAVRAARADGARLVPVGGGARVEALRPDAAPTVGSPAGGAVQRLALTALVPEGADGVLEYVPGDGVVTARAGASIAGVAAAVREGGHRLTPRLPSARTGGGATLGGLVGEGRSGLDRIAFGPLRHHVLGLRLVDGKGRAVRSGGRLVKNVTGFDLHRLAIGARGALGAVLEVSLRLVPAPEAERALARDCDGPGEALEIARRLRADARLHPRALFTRGGRVHLVLGGRGAQVAAEAMIARDLAGPFDADEEGEDAAQCAIEAGDVEAAARISVRPSRVRALLDALAGGGVDVLTATVQPDAAEIAVSAAALPGAAEDLGARVAALGATARAFTADAARLLGAEPPGRERTTRLERRVLSALDPAGVFGPGPSPHDAGAAPAARTGATR